MKRRAGVLLNVSSLPGRYGIGGFSEDAERFLEEIGGMGFKVWQTLPITATGAGDSPYSGISSFAGNYVYIDPERMEGLLTEEEIAAARYPGDIYLTDYAFVRKAKKEMLRKAYARLDETKKAEMEEFKAEQDYWISDYAAFMVLKEKFGEGSWAEWPEKYKAYSAELKQEILSENAEEAGFYFFEQFMFFRQWKKIHDCAKNYGIEIFGDLPIYVSYDSVDVWAHADIFLMGKDHKPKLVAGVPPDYFAKDGQLWGNPLYDYKKMAKDGYSWWVERLKHALSLYDILRIDHFRGLYEFWGVPAEAETAKEGKWYKGPHDAIFKELKKVLPEHEIVAEDLGLIDDKVAEFLVKCGYPGMKVMQFGFDGDVNNPHLPHNYVKNCVAYTGTHDNDTTLGWLLSLDNATRQAALDYVDCDSDYGWASGGGYCRATKAFMRSVIASCADLAIIPMQDLCGYGSDTRMNTPGVAEGCWRYRTNYTAINNVDRDFLRKIIRIYGR